MADRFLNTKSAIYLLRTDQREKAKSIIGLFTRVTNLQILDFFKLFFFKKKEGEDPEQHFNEMQTNWYAFEAGNSYVRTNHFGPALKKFTATEKVF